MQCSLVLLAAAVFAPSLFAQTNPFLVFPQDPERMGITAASYVRRPEWNSTGEGFQQVTQDQFRGVGDTGGGIALARGFYHWAGDLNGSTPETYGIVLRTADPLGQPDTTPAGVLVQVNNLTTPVGPPVAIGWIMTDVFATPVALPTNASWFQGLYLPANPAWPSGTATSPPDGHSIWAADTLAAGTPATVGENGRFTAPPVTWRVNTSGAAALTQWTYIMGTLVDNPTLHVGGIDPLSSRTGVLGAPSYGMNGLFPDVSGAPRSDGINLRLQDNVLPGGIAVFAGALGWWPAGGLPIGFGGDLYLDITSLVLLGAAIPVGGAATMPVASPGTISPALIGQSLMFQGMWFDPATGGGRMSNAQVTIF
jgi:hypothetical protein